MNYYLEMLKKSIKRIEADFDFSAVIDHNSSKGTFREHIIKNFLRPFLPGCYGISGGQAFNDKGELSKQLDIVIYDSLYSYIAPYMEDFIYFPCESVYGNIEIKSRLDKASFIEAVENIASLKKLKREKADTYYINPITPLVIEGVKWNIQVLSEYLGIIFAYDSVKADTILCYISEVVQNNIIKREHLPNIIVLMKEKKIITRYYKNEDNKYEIRPIGEFYGFMVEDCEDNILSEFLILLFVLLRNINLKAMDIQKLSKEVHREIFKKDSKEIIKNIII